jgi:hypothetical protein
MEGCGERGNALHFKASTSGEQMDTETTTEPAKIGRPTSLNQHVQDVMVAGVKKGLTLRLCCMAAGISTTSLHEWRERAKEGEQPFADFAKALEQAEADHAASLLTVIADMATGAKSEAIKVDSAKWLLAQRHPHDYGRNVAEVVHSGTVATVKVELPEFDPSLSMDERLAILRAMGGHER